MINCQKELFDIPEHISYLNAAYMGPMMKESAAQGRSAVDKKLHPWEISIDSFFELPNKACELVAKLIGSTQDDVAIVPSASYGIAIAAKNIDVREGQNIVIMEDQFPSNVYPWMEIAKERNAIVKTVSWPVDNDWGSAIANAIDGDTAIVACGHVHWTNGMVIDLKKISEKTKTVGAALVLDLTQSLGVMPFSVKDIDPDYMVAGSYKWLLGPYSYGYLYVAPRHQDGKPLEENWIARKDSENFARLVDYKDDYQPGARRFDMGERSNFIHSPIAIAALELFNELGVENIAAYLKTLTNYAAEKALALGLDVVEEAHRAPHLIGLNFKDGVPAHLAPKLAENNIFVSVRGASIRVAAHIYNDKNDIDRLVQVLEKEI